MTTPRENLYRVKPLEWERAKNYADWWTASTVFGAIDVEKDEDSGKCHWRYCFDEFYDQDSHECESVEAGKAAAERFYLDRLLPALESAT